MRRSDSLAAERHSRVLKQISADGVVRVDQLARVMDVSVATVRRDLRQLEDRGLVSRVFGGAVVAEDLAYVPRTHVQVEEKRRIADRAASLVSSGETVALDTGTTVTAVAARLKTLKGIVVTTNSIDAVLAFEGAAEVTALMTGGVFEQVTRSLSGPLVEAFYRTHRVDKLFIGAGSVSPDGLRDSNVSALEAKRAAISAASQTIVVADHTKFERTALALVCGWSSVKVLVTDRDAPFDIVAAVRAHGVDVIVA
jgi:DeoR family fructose operon transcriptional repressor